MLLPILVSVLPVFAEPANSSSRVASTDLLRLVPRDALLVAHVAPLDTLRADIRANAWWQLATDPTLAALWTKLEEHDAELAAHFDGLDPREFCESIHGQLALFVDATPDLEGATVGFLIEPGGDGKSFDGFVDKLRAKAALEGSRQQATHAGVTFELWGEKASDSDAGAEAPSPALAYVRCGAIAALLADENESELRSAANGLIERVQAGGGAVSMASHPGLLEARGRAHGPARVEFFLDLAPVSQKVLAETGDDEGQRWARELGLGDMRWVHARCDFAAGENLDLEIAAKLSPTGALTTWLGALHTPSSKLFAKIPADAASFGVVGFDVHGLWNDVWATFGRVDEKAKAAAQGQIAQVAQAMGGLDLERDLISQFTGDFATFTLEVPKDEVGAMLGIGMFGESSAERLEGLPALGEVHVIGVRDPLALEGTLEELFGLIGIGELIDSDDVDGQEIFYSELGEQARVSWWFGSDCVVVSVSPTAIRKAVAHAGEPGAPSAANDVRFAKLVAANSDAATLSVASTPTMLLSVGGAVLYVLSLEECEAASAVSAVDWKALVERYLKGTLTSTVRHQGGELRVHVSAR